MKYGPVILAVVALSFSLFSLGLSVHKMYNKYRAPKAKAPDTHGLVAGGEEVYRITTTGIEFGEDEHAFILDAEKVCTFTHKQFRANVHKWCEVIE